MCSTPSPFVFYVVSGRMHRERPLGISLVVVPEVAVVVLELEVAAVAVVLGVVVLHIVVAGVLVM